MGRVKVERSTSLAKQFESRLTLHELVGKVGQPKLDMPICFASPNYRHVQKKKKLGSPSNYFL
jgi:hypothetical protein